MTLDAIEILTFDCYGTLIDWESGIRESLAELRARHGVATPLDALLVEWEAIQFRQIAEPYRPYRNILRTSLTETFAKHGVDLSGAESNLLGERIGRWQPFADSSESLARLKRRYGLAILSNIDDDILAQSVAQLGIEFDELVTAQQVGATSPGPRIFAKLCGDSGVRPAPFCTARSASSTIKRPPWRKAWPRCGSNDRDGYATTKRSRRLRPIRWPAWPGCWESRAMPRAERGTA